MAKRIRNDVKRDLKSTRMKTRAGCGTYCCFGTLLGVVAIFISGILILRGLFGNLLSSIGKSHINFVIILIAIGLNIILNYYLIPIYEIFGAAITSAILMWFTGIICMLFFFYYYNKQNS